MQTSERLKALKAWVYENFCKGREMKTPVNDQNIFEFNMQEPKVYVGYYPRRPDETGLYDEEPTSVVPSILILPSLGYGKYTEERRFDRYNNIHRPKEMGQQLSVQFLFSVYEPGIRLPGFVESRDSDMGYDMTKLGEGTEEGLFTLTDWMDECMRRLIADTTIPGSDLALQEESIRYGLFSDQNFIVDKREMFYGVIEVTFSCYAEDGNNSAINDFLN